MCVCVCVCREKKRERVYNCENYRVIFDNVLDWDCKICEFELRSYNYIHVRINNFSNYVTYFLGSTPAFKNTMVILLPYC